MSSPPAVGQSRGLVGSLRRVPAKAWLRMAVLVAILFAGFALVRWTPLGDYFTREEMIALLERLKSSPWSPVALVAAYAVLAPAGMPMSPLVAGGGVVFGPWLGALYNTLGLVLGATTAFFLGKVLGRDFVVHLAGPRLRRAERIFERRGFWPLVQTRFLPVPFWTVSFAAAMAGVKVSRFLVTSTLGLIPSTLMHTYFMSTLILAPTARLVATYMVVWGAFNVVTGWPTLREGLRRRKRYRELMKQRRQSSGVDSSGS